MKLKVYILFILLGFLIACSNNIVNKEYIDFADNQWDLRQKAEFVFPVSDTLVYYNLYVDISNTNNYKYQNIWLFVETESPQGFFQRDTLDFDLAAHTGKWYGSKSGDTYSTRQVFKRQVRFPASGNYTLRIAHGMRDSTVAGVAKIGLIVEKYDKPKP